MHGACDENGPGVDNKSCSEMDTTEWKKKTKPGRPKIDWMQTVKEDIKRGGVSWELGEDTRVDSRQKDLEGAGRPVC